jgi:hypothetical protein
MCPAFHAAFGIESEGAPNHTEGFAHAADKEDSLKRALDCGKGMAATAYEIVTKPFLAQDIYDEFLEPQLE